MKNEIGLPHMLSAIRQILLKRFLQKTQVMKPYIHFKFRSSSAGFICEFIVRMFIKFFCFKYISILQYWNTLLSFAHSSYILMHSNTKCQFTADTEKNIEVGGWALEYFIYQKIRKIQLFDTCCRLACFYFQAQNHIGCNFKCLIAMFIFVELSNRNGTVFVIS